jgi:hypothetical protein
LGSSVTPLRLCLLYIAQRVPNDICKQPCHQTQLGRGFPVLHHRQNSCITCPRPLSSLPRRLGLAKLGSSPAVSLTGLVPLSCLYRTCCATRSPVIRTTWPSHRSHRQRMAANMALLCAAQKLLCADAVAPAYPQNAAEDPICRLSVLLPANCCQSGRGDTRRLSYGACVRPPGFQ